MQIPHTPGIIYVIKQCMQFAVSHKEQSWEKVKLTQNVVLENFVVPTKYWEAFTLRLYAVRAYVQNYVCRMLKIQLLINEEVGIN